MNCCGVAKRIASLAGDGFVGDFCGDAQLVSKVPPRKRRVSAVVERSERRAAGLRGALAEKRVGDWERFAGGGCSCCCSFEW